MKNLGQYSGLGLLWCRRNSCLTYRSPTYRILPGSFFLWILRMLKYRCNPQRRTLGSMFKITFGAKEFNNIRKCKYYVGIICIVLRKISPEAFLCLLAQESVQKHGSVKDLDNIQFNQIQRMVKLICEGETFQLKPEFEQLTTFFKDAQSFEDKKDAREIKSISKVDLERVIKSCELVNYKFNKIEKVDTNEAKSLISEPLAEFFKSLKPTELNQLYKASSTLRINLLSNNIAAYLATVVYIKLNITQYNQKKKELKIQEDLTPQRSKELKEKYIFLQN